MIHSGARQWRYDCTCSPEVAEARHSQEWQRMHSEVSRANAEYFVSEDRVDGDVEEADLVELVQEYAHVIVCNVCGDLKTLEGS